MRVVVADDSLLFREGLSRLLTETGFEVAATVGDASALLAEVERHSPDVAIVDIHMPPTQTTEGLEAAKRIRAPTNTYTSTGRSRAGSAGLAFGRRSSSVRTTRSG